MKRGNMKKHFLYICMAALIVILLLNACNSAASTTPTASQKSLDMFATDAAQTAFFQFTQQAQTQLANPTDTNTPEITPTATPSLPPAIPSETPVLPKVASCANATFVSETIPDGTHMMKDEVFTKRWSVTNSGKCAWTPYFRLVFSWGEAMGGKPLSLPNVTVGQTVGLSVVLTAPNKTGTQTGWWVLVDNNGKKFGVPLSVVIIVK
jgi:hypothetical protein